MSQRVMINLWDGEKRLSRVWTDIQMDQMASLIRQVEHGYALYHKRMPRRLSRFRWRMEENEMNVEIFWK